MGSLVVWKLQNDVSDTIKSTILYISISIEGVDKLLQGLSPNKASGPDDISPKLPTKELHHEIAPILTLIFNLSLETGVVPLD